MKLILSLISTAMFKIAVRRAEYHLARSERHLDQHEFWKALAEYFDAKAKSYRSHREDK